MLAELLFQFLNGAIKMKKGWLLIFILIRFQFLNGAIKMLVYFKLQKRLIYFNSLMVRLKFATAITSIIHNGFQFLNGAIKIGTGATAIATVSGFQFLNGAIKI